MSIFPPDPAAVAALDRELAELREPTTQLLRALKNASSAVVELALTTATFGVRAEMDARGLAREFAVDGRRRFRLTPLGEAAVDRLRALTAAEQEDLVAQAEDALQGAGASAWVSDPASNQPSDGESAVNN